MKQRAFGDEQRTLVDGGAAAADKPSLEATEHFKQQVAGLPVQQQAAALKPPVPFQLASIAHQVYQMQVAQLSSDTENSPDMIGPANNTGLPASLRSGVESLSGIPMDDVKVHYNSAKPAQLQAHAFTQGTDLHLAPGQERHLPHEAWHAVQQKQGRVAPTIQMLGAPVNDDENLEHEADVMGAKALGSGGEEQNEALSGGVAASASTGNKGVVQGIFNLATTQKNAHLRREPNWTKWFGPRISSGSEILVDDNNGQAKTQTKKKDSVLWRPAVSVPPSFEQKVPDKRKGFIRNTSVVFGAKTFETYLEEQITQILADAEAKYPSLGGHLNKPVNVTFMMDKAIRFDCWGKSSLESFVGSFDDLQNKLTRISDGADYVAESLEHWRQWLHSEKPEQVIIQNVDFLQSDLHEHGLGVMMVKFTKPTGPTNSKFANEKTVEVLIKPEDKSLEENLLGDKTDSAANQINQIVGLTDPKEMLTTIRMACTQQYGSLVEKVSGVSAEKYSGTKFMEPAFHETLVFAFLAGLDDLHHENVFWDHGKPYLIDADNVLSYNQMINKDNGAMTQSGFGSKYNDEEAKKNKKAIQSDKNTVNSKILKAMLEDNAKAIKIIDAIKGAISGQQGRVVPIRTNWWGTILKDYYPNAQNEREKDSWARDSSAPKMLVRETSGFDKTYGPGLFGTCYKNVGNEFYDRDAETKELRKDFEAGVVPFYNYEYDTGHVTHNGVKIYHGQTLEQAMQILIDKFGVEVEDVGNLL